jgi:hypothetical protein
MASGTILNFTSAIPIIENELNNNMNGLKQEIFDRVKQRTPLKTGKARAGWEIVGNTIRNDVHYIIDLEQGNSQQAPNGMLGVTLTEVPGLITTIFN